MERKFSYFNEFKESDKSLKHEFGSYSCYHPQRSWGKVIFSQASVILLKGGMRGRGCMAGGMCDRGLGACMGGMCGRGV